MAYLPKKGTQMMNLIGQRGNATLTIYAIPARILNFLIQIISEILHLDFFDLDFNSA